MIPETSPDRPVLFLESAGPAAEGETRRLSPEESRHVRALRLTGGADVRLTDGRGTLRTGTLGNGDDEGRLVRLGPAVPAPAPLPVELAVAVANRTHMLWLVEKATELGAARIVPVETRRSRSVADAARSRGFWRKAGRRSLSALKQSGGAWLPVIEPVTALDDWLARSRPETRILLASGALPLARTLGRWDGAAPVALLVGPEGGLAPDETEGCRRAGLRLAGLGPLTLRFETAAVAALAVVMQQREDAAPASRNALQGVES